MGEFILNGRNYGGSIITPNPSDTPTDSLDSIKINDTTYEIQGGGGGGSNLILDAQRYSLDEQVVGIWTDGKPLYQKTVHLSTLPSTAYTYTTYSHGIQNIDTICGWDSVARWNAGQIRRIPSTQYVDRSENIAGCFDVNITKTGIEIWVGQDRTALNSDFTIWYTKTTDVAGSGGYQAYGFTPLIYSEEEREVGVWKDNKPLYQKTVDIGALPNNNQKLVNHNISDFGEAVRVFGYARNTSNNAIIPLPHNHPNAANQSVSLIVTTTQISVQTGTNRSGYVGCVTIQYTKASDTAGSGEYNTLAIPNVHYSTDEQVIGTWIDGKTLYQRTWELSSVLSVASNTWVDTSILKQEIDAIIYINGANAEGAVFSFLGARAQTSTTNYVQIQQTRNSAITLKYITIQYTKTT